VPHAGFVYSGPIAASAFAALLGERDTIERIVLLGASHGRGGDARRSSGVGRVILPSMRGSEVAARFEIELHRCLDPEGAAIGALPEFARAPEALIALHRAMAKTRILDARAVALQRAGQLGTYPSSLGQEAVAVGVGSAMRPDDVLVPSFREHGTQLLRGVTPVEILLFWGGDERGCDFAGPREDLPVCIPVGSQVPHAAGVALAIQLRGEARAVVCVFGDGATSKGDFYEAINLAGVWSLPVVFVVVNNEWSISVPRAAQTAAETLAQKAVAAGIRGEQVDGNDVIAVRHIVSNALARARAGEGPSLIEALTYRLADHTTSDDARRYRDADTVLARKEEEPLGRLRRYLVTNGHWDEAAEQALVEECGEEVERAVEAYLATPPQRAESIFDHLYAELPAALGPQREAMLREASRRG
jgi:pyruvate dehydrogenase E1 component alpha subunit